MPFRTRFWRWRNYRRRYPTWRRRRPRTRRFRRPFWRTFRRRLRVRKNRYFYIKRLLYRLKKRKLKKLKVFQWQPKSIKKCKIKGYKCLFMAGPDRDSNNYAQYQESFINQHQPGGGGWSLLIFTLDGLYEEHLKCRNWWTVGNKGLPLCRYTGCKFKFFRDKFTDYCVNYSLCYPMLDAPLVHANSSPFNTILTRNRFIVPSKLTKPYGKQYITKHFRPPSQLKNKWYFQVDFLKTGLLLLTTTAVSLDNFYISPTSISNNISIFSLNPKIFTHNGIINIGTTGYHPTRTMSLFANYGHNEDPKLKELTFLGKPGKYTPEFNTNGTSFEQSKKTTQEYFSQDQWWGNPFHPTVLNKDIPLYISNLQYSNYWEEYKEKKVSESLEKITPLTEPLIIHLRYNPDRDTGQDNMAYLVSIERETDGFNPPADEQLKIYGLPLPTMLWGWLDWQKKLQRVHHIDTSYMLCIKTKFTDPQIDTILPIDENFLKGLGPYGLPKDELSLYTKSSWWPKVSNQLVTNNIICHSGPATPKYQQTKCIQAHCKYEFYFKWGGCPAPMVDIQNPALQQKYPVPDQLIQRLQIQNPASKPELELHDFDERRQEITKSCIERIQQFTETEQTILSITGPTNPGTETTWKKIQEEIQTPSQEKEDQTLQQQLQLLRKQQQLLKRAIVQLTKPNIE
nr:ORF1 [Torque teno mini virus 3]